MWKVSPLDKTATVGGAFLPTYNLATNQYSSIPGCTPSYDRDGNLTNDCMHSYNWLADGAVASVDTVSLTYDALGRAVEQGRGSSYTEIVYTPGGGKLTLMNGTTVQKAFIPLPGGGTAVYTTASGSSVAYYRHTDLLGSSRLASTPTAPTTVYADAEYAPYGESYGVTGTLDLNFTGQNQDTVPSQNGGVYDFLFREYNPQHGRWISPDPAGMNSVSLGSPQTWNRYAYVGNAPLTGVDPLGLDDNFFLKQLDAGNQSINFSAQGFENSSAQWALQDEYYNLPGHNNIQAGLYRWLSSGSIPGYSVQGGDLVLHTGNTFIPGYCPPGYECPKESLGTVVPILVDLGPIFTDTGAANNGPTATIGPPQEWHPAKQPSALSKYVAFLGCYGVSVSRTITDEEDGQGWTAYGFINAGAILAIRSGAVFTPVGYTFVATAGLMDLSAGVKANQECTAAIYH